MKIQKAKAVFAPPVHLTLKSSNAKTGPIPVSTTGAETCPAACPLRGGGCYANSGPLALHWQKVSSRARGVAWAEFCNAIQAFPANTLWRHNQAGDLPGHGNDIDAAALLDLVAANQGRRGFTYTHNPPTPRNADKIRAANRAGFTVNLSGNNPRHADKLAALKIGPVVCIVPDATTTKTPGGLPIEICPAQTDTTGQKNCLSCQKCQKQNRSTVIGFIPHGTQKRKAATVAGKV